MHSRRPVFALDTLAFAFALGSFAGCEKKETDAPDEGSSDKKGGNLCTDYKSCNECIVGQQAKG